MGLRWQRGTPAVSQNVVECEDLANSQCRYDELMQHGPREHLQATCRRLAALSSPEVPLGANRNSSRTPAVKQLPLRRLPHGGFGSTGGSDAKGSVLGAPRVHVHAYIHTSFIYGRS